MPAADVDAENVLAIAGAANSGSAMGSAFDNYKDLGWEVVDSDTCKWGFFLSIGGGAIAVIVGAVGVGLHVKIDVYGCAGMDTPR